MLKIRTNICQEKIVKRENKIVTPLDPVLSRNSLHFYTFFTLNITLSSHLASPVNVSWVTIYFKVSLLQCNYMFKY